MVGVSIGARSRRRCLRMSVRWRIKKPYIMRLPRLIFAYAVIAVFIGFCILGALGILGWVAVADRTTQVTIISGSFGIVVAILKAHSLFHDPETIAELRAEHAETIRAMKEQHAEAITGQIKVSKEREADYLKIIAKKDTELCQEREVRISAEDKLARVPARRLGDYRRE